MYKGFGSKQKMRNAYQKVLYRGS